MSIDRYLAIRHPMAFRKIFNKKTTLFVILALWIVALAIFAPVMWVRQLGDVLDLPEHEGIAQPVFCYENWPERGDGRLVYGILCFVLVYAVPGSVVVLAYSLMGLRLCAINPPFDGPVNDGMAVSRQCTKLVRERRRVARILLLLAVLFAFCWLPYNVLALAMDLGYTEGLMQFFSFALLLGHANSAINPIIYCFMTRNFRRAVRELILRSRVSLGTRQLQRCNIRAPYSATTSSGYDSYHSPHRLCYTRRNLMEEPSIKLQRHHHLQTASSTRTNSNLIDNNRYL